MCNKAALKVKSLRKYAALKLKYSGFTHPPFNAAIKVKNLSFSASIKPKIILKILKSNRINNKNRISDLDFNIVRIISGFIARH